ncbi:LPXTG-motif cell wall anchor domain-containing protein/fibro-slime domain-containing protein [Gemmiger formicilis]|uniref:LPXTG-motif cell wall anchor domain-containing protein/fibro-slime domain-containing protein n=1 Tax=Gemmiger formicilis TaxID=745368 RepID=A0A1T4WG97_9FIRM|nr:SpaA isopeptide-forming pilin-related protein [Gemmiger formicilis]SKA75988.1 LPXTG-motif cell wall anchor domain-containing protein/fibro-slime domain-containing protein [Gemmiger formicilis]
MTKAFSILHRAAALLVALCLLIGMALPVYAAEDEALFFDAGSETIPTIPAANTSSEGVEPAQEPIVSDLETIPDEGDTPPTANEPGTEAGNTVNNTAAVPNNDGKTQEAAENQTPAADTDTAPATDNAPAADKDATADKATAVNAQETTAAKTNTEQDVLFADGDNPNEEDTMPADDLPDNDDANTPDTIADTGASQGFIPATATIYFEDDGRYDSKLGGKCTIHFHACTDSKTNAYIDKVMADTGETVTDQDGKQHKIFSVTLNSADYPAGGFYRIIFQYMEGNSWKEEINAFGNDNVSNTDKLTAIDLLAGKKLVSVGITNNDQLSTHFNQNQPYNPSQWTRVEYYYKDTPLYFQNASSTDLNNVTAVFYKQDGTNGTVKTTSLPIGTVEAGKFYAQKILIPDNQSQFVQFTWDGNGESDLYNFSTDPYDNVPTFDLTKANCFVYNDSASSWQSAGNDLLAKGKTIYFDATLSSYGYEGEGLQQQPMPGSNKKMYCFLTDSASIVTSQEMTLVKADPATPDPATDRQLWSYTIPDGKTYTAVQFSATDNQDATAQDNKTKVYTTAELPPTLTEPCFFADDGDPSAYSQGTVVRDGYWGEKDSLHDAESGKNSTVVDIDNSGIFTQQKGTKYITSTLYDYYTDYELNGLNRDSAPNIDGSSQRRFVTFEQFDRALSSAYTKSDNVKYPLYTGHFEPTGGASFAGVAGGMKLYGWGKPDGDPDQKALYNTFMAVNNSTYDDKGGQQSGDYSRTFQGLVESKTSDGSANGLPLLRAKDSITTNALVDPHFDEAFLQGKNSFNTVLGKVYKDVSFPFTKDAVFKSSTNPNDPEQYAEYWYYDSSKASLYLKQDKGDGKYYLESPIDDEGKPTTHANSKNINASHGFFPFNQTVSTVGASQYNYGFGAKLQFDFTLTDDGQVVAGNDSNTKVPIKFFFSGDDDVWVYIDGKLVLDVGGAHGKASGLLEFGKDNTVTPYVSSNKNTDTKDPMVYTTDAKNKTVYFNQTPITFTKTTSKAIPLDKDLTTHTLTMFYMERGMWDSNMAVAFNFPDSNELQVEKEVNVDKVNDAFKDLFKDQKLFTFTLQNLATHYGAKPIADNGTPKPVEVGSNFTASSSNTDKTTMEKDDNPPDKSGTYHGQTVKWYAQGYDKGSQHRDLRYGTMTLEKSLNIEKRDYLSFDVYAVGNTGDGVLSTNYLYLTLEDDKDNQMGCDLTNGQKSYLNTMLSGSVVMQNNQWVTVKLQLSKMPQDDGFDLKNIKKIRIGDDYERTVYFRNFVFTAKPVVKHMVGFSVEQEDIPDYGSVENNTLKPASGAIFTSSVASSGTQAVDTDGTFDLQDGETVTFTDQFRRGSYISLQETENTALYDTRWEVYENGTLVNTAGESSSVNAASPLPLQGNSTKPEDNRTEKADNPPTDNSYDGNKPKDAKTLVFRSYAAPEEEFPKLKVKFINTVKVGTLVIKKEQANDGSDLTGKSYKFTVTFSNVGGIGLGGVEPMTNTIPVDESWEITGIPIGTRFQVVETPADGSSLKSVICDATDAKYDVDNGVRGTVTSEAEQVTATFTNTAHQLMDIEVEKQWQDADDKPLTDNLPDAIWVKLERRHVNDTTGAWQDVPSMDAVELKYDYMSKTWTHTFERLDKTDVNDGNTPYVYRVAECASKDGKYKADGTVTIGAYTYTASQTDLTDGKITLTNKRTDPEFALNLTKMGIDGTTTPLLGGVEFKLEKLKADGTAEAPKTCMTGSDGESQGKCSFTSLSPGNYRLTETKTADGYTLLSEAIEFTLKADGQCLRDGAAFGAKTTDADGVCNIALTIYNRKGFTLPHTGADAPSLWLLIGLPALVAVLLVLVFRYNKKGGKHS